MKGNLEGITQAVAGATVGARFEDLPKVDIDKIKRVFLDAVGCALASRTVDKHKIVIEMTQEFGGSPQSTIIGGHHTSYALAAFANGELINALDYDILGPLTGHVCPFVTPSCLAMAERMHASGRQFILALALAHETGGRTISSLAQHKILKDTPPYYEDTERFGYGSNIFGGVAGAGKLLGLDVKKMANAFGIAGASTVVPGVMKWQHTPGPSTMTKYNTWAGWVAQLATVAALLAEKGFTGDTTILDGNWGYWNMVGSPIFNVDTLLEGLGKIWHITEIDFKMYPVCRLHHAGIEGINTILRKYGIAPQEIEQIVVKADHLLQMPNRAGTNIESYSDVQFSNAFIFAIGAYYGSSPNPAWQTPGVYDDPRVVALSKKVKVELHPRTEELVTARITSRRLPVFTDTVVEITAKGNTYSVDVAAPKGTKANPMTDAELITKFKANALCSDIAGTKAEDIIQMTMELDRLEDMTKLTALLTAR